ncbi:replication endonuclease [Pectobacterium parmentieri]|uniref:Replication endonuclease n=1 Tax=Pectobacterium parmentieri TaxID=1905730 RepID=A0A0H3I5B0_PECPM|nr:replication endonuclease [Pectobacterium parmentieri]AFI90434.1 Putative replication initiation protein [Pectobacterium parmentieri]MBI0473472.1 replication endonuclease [Pectobacterium parmentieri]MBI0495958.1 replication endonuclease [Pectobacterium parmentieri]MBI0557376.1 replication endonuclease [Pectobacterium parmentieri]MBI0570544.1 replication endonuclease [Pectobacterium parmentieri]
MFSERLVIADKNFSHYAKLGKIYLRDRRGIALRSEELAGEFKSLIGGSGINEYIDQSFKNIFTKKYFSDDFDGSDILVFDEKLNFCLSALHRERDFFNLGKIETPESADFFENSVFMRVARAVRVYGLQMPKVREIFDFLSIPFSDWPNEIQNVFYGSLARVSAPEYWQPILWRIRCHWMGCRDTARNRVHKKISPYVSVRALREFLDSQKRMKNFLENNELESSDGDRISLETAYNSGNSCPKNRRTELMTRLRHTGEFFTSEGFDGYFLTITLPSAYHPNHIDGRENSRCTIIDPRAGHEELSRIWRNVGRKFARDEIFFAGFRFTEPHHDGTPHWHCVIWFRPQQADAALKILRDRYCERDFAEISHNPEVRFKSVPIDPERGAAAYCAAYISKNIDGFQMDIDSEAGLNAVDGATRATTWARLYRIRQFQQFGCVGSTAWRELRRQRTAPVDCDPVLRDFWQAADSGDFGAFIRLSREHGGVSLYRADADFAGRELRNQWGEKTSKIRGVCLSADPLTRVQTRTRDWSIVPKQVENPPISDAVQRCGTPLAPWTSGNNCPLSKQVQQENFDFSIDPIYNDYREAANDSARLRI